MPIRSYRPYTTQSSGASHCACHALITIDDRSTATTLLDKARQNFNLHEVDSVPYTLKISFASTGKAMYEGNGTLEETWIDGTKWRWVAQMDNSSTLRIPHRGGEYETGEPVRLRVQMVRDAVFSPIAVFPSRNMIRSAPSTYIGRDINCTPLSGSVPTTPALRYWVENEYCIEPSSGSLQMWSEAPGIYGNYDYSGAIPAISQLSAFEVKRPNC